MRTIKLVFLLVFVSGMISSFQARSQAKVVFDKVIVFYDMAGKGHLSIESKTTYSASGNIVKTAKFRLPKGHELIPEKWTTYVGAQISEVNFLGEEVVMTDYNIAIKRDGTFKIVYHSNGAGSIFPVKFKDIFD
jgi:hypothetical protein